MEPVYRTKTQDTPDVILDRDKNKFYFAGRSLSENPVEFYLPLVRWFDQYLEQPVEKTVVEFQFEYYNSSSARILANILGKLENLHKSGSRVEIHWYYKVNDKDMLESGQRYAEAFALPFYYFPW